jgi:hypothetical protein
LHLDVAPKELRVVSQLGDLLLEHCILVLQRLQVVLCAQSLYKQHHGVAGELVRPSQTGVKHQGLSARLDQTPDLLP